MANATVEKLKALGIRHGEKAAVGLAAVLCVLFLVVAVAKPTIDLTADQVKDDARKAEQNITREQSRDDILAKLEQEGLKESSFEKTVDGQAEVALDSSKFTILNPWAAPEPGAGLIADQPVLLAPTDLIAHSSRGGTVLFALDDDGNRIVKLVKDDQKAKKKHTRKRGRSLAGMAYGGMGRGGYGGGYGMPGSGGGSRGKKDTEKERKKEREEKEKQLNRVLAGSEKTGAAAKDKEEEENEPALKPGEEYQELVKGIRWVALLAEIDHKKMRENYAAALKRDFASANPNYVRLDLERQARDDDGDWSQWSLVDREANEKILFNVAEADDELTPDDVRLEALVDFLPFLRAGYWKGVHLRSLVPKEKKELPKEEENPQGMYAGGGGYGMSGRAGGAMMDYGQMMKGRGGSGSMMGGMMGGYGMPGSGGGVGYMGGGFGGATEDQNFAKTEAERIMARALDFTVEPDTTYRYRVRIVVLNPNKDHENVAPGVDSSSDELTGPWSEPSDEVTVPPDVTAYVRHMLPVEKGGRSDRVQFQVARWNPEDGLTVYKTFDAGPGQIVGSTRHTEVPILDDSNPKEDKPTKTSLIDYNTHQVVLDTDGGPQPLPRIPGISGANFEEPATALLLRPDGSVVIRDQVIDHHNEEMAEMKTIYDNALAEAKDKDKKSTTGYGAEGMAPGGGYGGLGPGGGQRRGRR